MPQTCAVLSLSIFHKASILVKGSSGPPLAPSVHPTAAPCCSDNSDTESSLEINSTLLLVRLLHGSSWGAEGSIALYRVCTSSSRLKGVSRAAWRPALHVISLQPALFMYPPHTCAIRLPCNSCCALPCLHKNVTQCTTASPVHSTRTSTLLSCVRLSNCTSTTSTVHWHSTQQTDILCVCVHPAAASSARCAAGTDGPELEERLPLGARSSLKRLACYQQSCLSEHQTPSDILGTQGSRICRQNGQPFRTGRWKRALKSTTSLASSAITSGWPGRVPVVT